MSAVTRRIGRVFSLNPVTLRDMKARMRGPRSYGLIGLYLITMAILLYIVYIQSGGGSSYSYGNPNSFSYGPTRSYEIGQNLFITIFLYLILVVALVAPAITGVSISREVESRTYELLLVTSVKRRSLIYSKFLSGLFFVLLLVLLSLPFTSMLFIFGGVDLGDLLGGYAIVFISAAAFCAIGIFFSALLKQSGLALLSSYVLIVVLVLGSQLISSSIVSAINSDNSRFPAGATRPDTRIDPAFDLPKRILVLNPLAAVGSVISPNAPYRLTATEDLKYFPASTLFGGNPATYFRQVPGPQNAQANAISRLPVLPNGWALWGGYVLVYSGITAMFLIVSTTVVKIGRMEKGFFKGKKQKKPRQKKEIAINSEPTTTGV